jgi:hypothetical protein
MLVSLLSDSTGVIPTHLRPVHDALAASEPAALLQWISKRSTAPALLAELSRRNQPLTHRHLDDRRPDRAMTYLRKILVTAGALPPRDEHLAITELWAADTIAQITDPKDRQTIREFATWHALRRLRQASGRYTVSAGQAMGCRATIRAAIILTAELHERNTTLETCTQREIDDLLVAHKIDDRTRPFVLWATTRGHAQAISIPYRRGSHTPRPRIADDHRWAFVHHLLHDSDPAIEDRVAGLLILLFAQPLHRIVSLKHEHISTAGPGTQLTLGSHPIDLPTPIDTLVLQLTAKPRGKSALGNSHGHPWLFPGGAPGHPLTPAALGARLKRIGIEPEPHRQTALFDLAGQMPASVLSRLVGIAIETADRWTRQAGIRGSYAAIASRRGGV